MTQQQRFYRKIIYIVIIAVLIVPLYMLGNPAQRTKDGTLTQGGELARIRDKHGLAEVNLGEIDPASSTMKLATFGMRGVAIALLWNRSLEYEKRADWNNVVATGNQIIKLEPHFITIWDFVGWKLAYNASAQFDDYRERYRWVIRGFDFLQKGTTYNHSDPRLFSKAGWTISQKIGIADEKDQYRRLFREDEEFHSRQHFKERDNWLFGRNYYQNAEKLYEAGGSIGKETRILFYSRSRMNLMHYAEWMSIDGCGLNKTNTPIFDQEHTAVAWKRADEAWRELSKMVITTVIEDKTKPGEYRKTSLNAFREYNADIDDLIKTLESMLPVKGQTRDAVIWERWNKELNDQQRAALLPSILRPADENDYNMAEVDHPFRVVRSYLDGKQGEQPEWADWQEKLQKDMEGFYSKDLVEIYLTPSFLRSETDSLKLQTTEMRIGEWRNQAANLLNVTPEVLADRIKGDDHLEAQDICDRITALREESRFSGMYRDIMDARRHERRVIVEQQSEALKGRELRYEARVKYRAAQHEEANKAFLGSMAAWKALTDKPGFEDIRRMPQFMTQFLDEAKKYIIVLDQLERIFPNDYPFQDIVASSPNISHSLNSLTEAIIYVEKEMAEGKFVSARDHADKSLVIGGVGTKNDEILGLNAVPVYSQNVIKAAKFYVEAWEKIGGKEFEEAKKSGLFDNYNAKEFVELMINKGDPQLDQARKEALLAITEPDKALEHYEKAVDIWKELLVRYPILKYDTTSEFRTLVQSTAQGYLTELKKADKEEPKDFVLKNFF